MRNTALSLTLVLLALPAFAGHHAVHHYVLHHGGEELAMPAGPYPGFDRAFLGVQLTDLTAELRAHFGVPEDAGVMVAKVVDDSPAFVAGLRVGDVITGIGDKEVVSGRGFAREIAGREEGETIDLEIWRDGRVERISATLERREEAGLRAHGFHHLGHCGEGEPCRVEVRCEEGDCDCTMGGEPIDCERFHRRLDRD